MSLGGLAYPSLDAFYAAEHKRLSSPEWDYGVHWRTGGRAWPTWRVSWVVETGELYAVRMSAGQSNAVLILGVVPKLGDYPYGLPHERWAEFMKAQPIEAVMEGWAEVAPNLDWVRRRVAEFDGA